MSLSYTGTWGGPHQMDPRHPLQRIPAGHRSLSLPSGTRARGLVLDSKRAGSALRGSVHRTSSLTLPRVKESHCHLR
ncbi:hypothetical protein GH5_04652 [Leishmania sp. Ghana 2012 LV757]|uniref:hypothetical protein n=1 Tax=Leishmania sp. Ghana 2012 LV757 TaxID=2803181 RepID=UPI001B78A530|nr:hypothetical protein GH5_04652 [Leishmania sp. Ghana 2012 LV757]